MTASTIRELVANALGDNLTTADVRERIAVARPDMQRQRDEAAHRLVRLIRDTDVCLDDGQWTSSDAIEAEAQLEVATLTLRALDELEHELDIVDGAVS